MGGSEPFEGNEGLNKLVDCGILIATKNIHKIEEIKSILHGDSYLIRMLTEFPDIADAPEDGKTYEENSMMKALFYAEKTGMIAVADDSGLEIDFLGGKPGVHSARFIDKNASFLDRNRKILEWMKDVNEEERRAKFVCFVSIASPGRLLRTFAGELNGFIGREIKGENGFGYDPIFYVPEYGKMLAELPSSVKNQISHRARAFKAAQNFIREKA